MANPSSERERLDDTGDRIAGAATNANYGAPVVRDLNPDAHAADGRNDAGDRSIATLLKELRDESTTLIRQELALAKTEMSEKAAAAGRNATSIAIGSVLLLLGAIVLVMGVTVALYFGLVGLGLSHTWAGLISFLLVGGGLAGVGYMLMQKGIKRFKEESLVPQKTIQSLNEDKQWLTNQTK